MALPRARASKTWQGRFITALGKNPNVVAACRTARISRTQAYRERDANQEFEAQWLEALDEGVETLEAEAHRRAMKQSDTLMIFLLKAHRPDKYRERWDGDLRLRGSVGIHPIDLTQLSDEDIEALEGIVGKIGISTEGAANAGEIAAYAGGDRSGEGSTLALAPAVDATPGASV